MAQFLTLLLLLVICIITNDSFLFLPEDSKKTETVWFISNWEYKKIKQKKLK